MYDALQHPSNSFLASKCQITIIYLKKSIVRQITPITNNITQLNLENNNLQDLSFRNEIKKQNPVNIINFCLNNQTIPKNYIILAICYRYGKWVEKMNTKHSIITKNYRIFVEYFSLIPVIKPELELKG
ncbi:hypothetical protein C2G38_2169754 [Gigaspora rosea]|uniref:Uncharacterized protein n=1 Tax=Gigaspora rosea TaxID=44941 RepID=A0A397VVG0_9GLOM|nr:hypothetical protein C2G38_2169754 [Gigaspora rosea]